MPAKWNGPSTHIVGAAHDAAIEVHLLAPSVTVHAPRVPRFNGGQRCTAESNQPRVALTPPITPGIGVVCLPILSRRETWLDSAREYIRARDAGRRKKQRPLLTTSHFSGGVIRDRHQLWNCGLRAFQCGVRSSHIHCLEWHAQARGKSVKWLRRRDTKAAIRLPTTPWMPLPARITIHVWGPVPGVRSRKSERPGPPLLEPKRRPAGKGQTFEKEKGGEQRSRKAIASGSKQCSTCPSKPQVRTCSSTGPDPTRSADLLWPWGKRQLFWGRHLGAHPRLFGSIGPNAFQALAVPTTTLN
eukprot:5036548-Amphidinium_carterae.2